MAAGRSSVDPKSLIEMYIILGITFPELFTILALSNFSGQQSTLAQRAWTVTWLVNGCVIGSVLSSIAGTDSDFAETPMLTLCVGMVLYGAPAIGGFVVVSQMLKAYGICYKFV
jgi:hypothetical protein